MPTKDNIHSVLTRAKEIISKPEQWTQGAYAKNEQGESVHFLSDEACCFCILGAVCKSTEEVLENVWFPSTRMRDVLYKTAASMGFKSAAKFNDNSTHERVMQFFDTAIKINQEITV